MKQLFLDIKSTFNFAMSKIISIGLVLDDDHTFYGECNDFGEELSTKARQHYLPSLESHTDFHKMEGKHYKIRDKTSTVRFLLRKWFQGLPDTQYEVWVTDAPANWNIFRRLFYEGLPDQVFDYGFDIGTLFRAKGSSSKLSDFGQLNHALESAKLIRYCYTRLMSKDVLSLALFGHKNFTPESLLRLKTLFNSCELIPEARTLLLAEIERKLDECGTITKAG